MQKSTKIFRSENENETEKTAGCGQKRKTKGNQKANICSLDCNYFVHKTHSWINRSLFASHPPVCCLASHYHINVVRCVFVRSGLLQVKGVKRNYGQSIAASLSFVYRKRKKKWDDVNRNEMETFVLHFQTNSERFHYYYFNLIFVRSLYHAHSIDDTFRLMCERKKNERGKKLLQLQLNSTYVRIIYSSLKMKHQHGRKKTFNSYA